MDSEEPKGVMDIDESIFSNVPPVGAALPDESAFDVSKMNRADRRKLEKKHKFKIVGTNKPFVKPKYIIVP
jgi:hypothetical protein